MQKKLCVRETGRKKGKEMEECGPSNKENGMHGIRDLKGTAFCVHKFVKDSEFEFSLVCADAKFVLV